MNYRHLYHAGNFADVVKHVFLISLIQYFKKKETPFCYLDTHAGIGLYNLASIEAQKKQEYETGVSLVFQEKDITIPKEVTDYISIINTLNAENTIQKYPGSPWIAKSLLREKDKIILSELHKDDIQTLKENLRGEKNIAIHHQDAYSAMKAFLPPKEKRGIILIDPPFEAIDEFEKITHALKIALQRFPSGAYMIWYPVKDKASVKKFLQSIEILQKPYLNYFFSIDKNEAKTALNECGILMINPPWLFEENIQGEIMPYFKKIGILAKLSHQFFGKNCTY